MERKLLSYNEAKVQDYSLVGDVNKYLENIVGKEFSKYREDWNKATRLKKVSEFPLFLVFEPMWKCNLKCIMCLHSSDNHSSFKFEGKLPWSMYKNIMQEAKQYGCPSMTIGGHCEPFLDNRLADMVLLAKESGIIDIMINTNATLLKKNIGNKLIKNGLTRLRVGFDGASAEIYEKVRVGANFEKVKNNIMSFIESRNKLNSLLPVVRVSCVHLSVNNKEIDDFINFWTPVVDYVSIQRYRPHDHTKGRDRINLGAGVEVIKKLKCSEPWERLYIRGNGDVYPCCLPTYAPKVGNLKNSTIYEIWNSETMNNLRSAIKEGKWELVPKCKECMIKNFSSTGS